jgi:hypothetical protein
MMRCAYCGRQATMKIESIPEDVCVEHGVEFYAGLLVYATERSDCVKHERVCSCRLCEEASMSQLRAIATATAGSPPTDRRRFPIRLAS